MWYMHSVPSALRFKDESESLWNTHSSALSSPNCYTHIHLPAFGLSMGCGQSVANHSAETPPIISSLMLLQKRRIEQRKLKSLPSSQPSVQPGKIKKVHQKPYIGGANADTIRFVDECNSTQVLEDYSASRRQEDAQEQVCVISASEELQRFPEVVDLHYGNGRGVVKPEAIINSIEIKKEHYEKGSDHVAQPVPIDVTAMETPDKVGTKTTGDALCGAEQAKDECDYSIEPAEGIVPLKKAASEAVHATHACGPHMVSEEVPEKPKRDTNEQSTTEVVECDVIVSQEGSAQKAVKKSFNLKPTEHTSVSVEIAMNHALDDSPNSTSRSPEDYVTHKEKTTHPDIVTTTTPTPQEMSSTSHAPKDGPVASESVVFRNTIAAAPPTPPPRRNSILPDGLPPGTPMSVRRSYNRQPSISSSRTNTMNYSMTLGRLSFPTLPRNARPPRKEEFSQKRKARSMFSWLGGDSSKKKNKEVLDSVSEGLRKIYKQKLYPLEEHYKFHEFHSPALDDPDFDAKPMILLVGQYSTGKTTFIRYLLEEDFPGIRIGPEPTTDRFIAVMHGEEEGVIPGNALVVDAKKQFRALSGFGNAFLNRFQCSTLNNQVLESVTIVDTPGILSGEKQRIDRGYDFTGVLEWFAERNEDKIRIVLNKSDMVDHQQLMRVYGALMWSLGKVFKTPEVSRVYIGTFWDHPLHYDINRRLFQDEQHDLFQDLQALPRNAALRKLNDLIKRARLAKVHAYIIAELRKQMPSMIGKDKKKKELIQNLDKIFEQVQREHNISPGDFPDVNKMRDRLQTHDFTRFNPIKPKLLEIVDGMLASDIARLMAQIPKEEAQITAASTTNGHVEQPTVKGGAFSQAQEAETPFGFGRGEGFDRGADEPEWVVSRERTDADATFDSLGPVDGFISGRVAKEHMVKSKLPNSVLGKIWKLADVDRDGQLDADEFALANYLINLKLEGHELPVELPKHLIPPSKRDMEPVYPKLDDE
ncbi:hypothetical protein GCK32_002135 [Trichostrongylus colubriformis]|uniref:Uncharacterized protein n=1 Tax=Trichostrongylus colubriformis TaxID=6319 RepID=A0AAN8IBQ7_TRICO